jgi:hypothetical protein
MMREFFKRGIEAKTVGAVVQLYLGSMAACWIISMLIDVPLIFIAFFVVAIQFIVVYWPTK